jgi:hypothetical protein
MFVPPHSVMPYSFTDRKKNGECTQLMNFAENYKGKDFNTLDYSNKDG